MKIAFPAAGSNKVECKSLSGSFTESGLIGIYDSNDSSVDVFSKEEINSSFIDWISEKQISSIITPEIQMMALKVFKEEGLEVYKAEGALLALNINLLLSESLRPFSVSEVNAEGGSCTSSCSSCKSTSCNT